MTDDRRDNQPGSRFEDLLDLVCEELATENEVHELQIILREDKTALRTYVERMRLCADLYSVAEDESLYNRYLQDHASSLLHGDNGTDPLPSESILSIDDRRPRWTLLRNRSSKLLIAATIAGLIALTPALRIWQASNDSKQVPLGKWTNGANAEWAQNSLVFVGDSVSAGVYQLRTGIAEVTLNTGAVLTIEGPASVEFLSADHCSVQFGQVVTRLPADASGLRMTGAHTALIYPGAEAGLRVTRAGYADFHVYGGEIELLPANKVQTTPIILAEHKSLSVEPNGRTDATPASNIQSPEFVRRLGPLIEIDPKDSTSSLADDFNDGKLSVTSFDGEDTDRFQIEENGGEFGGIIRKGVFDPRIDVELPGAAISAAEFPYCRYRLLASSANDVRIAELFYYHSPADRPIVPGDRRSIQVSHYAEGPTSLGAEFRGMLPVVEVPPIKFLRLDPIHQASNSDCEFAYDYVFFDKYETIGVAEFDRADDFQNWWGLGVGQLKVADGSLRGQVEVGDAQLFTGNAVFDADQFTHLEIRMRRLPSETHSLKKVEVFWEKAGDIFSPEKKAKIDLVEDSEFHTYRLDLRRANGWGGVMKRLRLDFETASSTDGSRFEIDYLRVIRIESSIASLEESI